MKKTHKPLGQYFNENHGYNGSVEEFLEEAAPLIGYVVHSFNSLDSLKSGKTDRDSNTSFPSEDIWLIKETLPAYDFFMPDGVLWNCISEKAKGWLEINCDDLLNFKELKIK